jgi:hypothetical protein
LGILVRPAEESRRISTRRAEEREWENVQDGVSAGEKGRTASSRQEAPIAVRQMPSSLINLREGL